MNSKISSFLLMIVFLTGCETTDAPVMTPLEIRTIQTRSFESDYNVTFRSVVAVFQDLGYTIQSAELTTGFIQANGASDSNEALKFWIGATQTTQTKATGFVEEIGNKVNVRLSFVKSVESSTMYGADDRNETQILDAGIYQNAFERIENAIFVRTSSE